VAAVAWQPDGCGDEQPREARYENDVPPGRLAPAELFRDHVPDEVDQIVDRRLEEHGRKRDRQAE
jgi:hypothetical protein